MKESRLHGAGNWSHTGIEPLDSCHIREGFVFATIGTGRSRSEDIGRTHLNYRRGIVRTRVHIHGARPTRVRQSATDVVAADAAVARACWLVVGRVGRE